MILYKLTDEHAKTRGDTLWGPNVTHTPRGAATELCTDGYIHAYEHPLLAVLFNPVHGNFDNPRLWEAEGEVVKRDSMKVGCSSLTTIREIPLPDISCDTRIRFGILVALTVQPDTEFQKWADAWLRGKRDEAPAARMAKKMRKKWSAGVEGCWLLSQIAHITAYMPQPLIPVAIALNVGEVCHASNVKLDLVALAEKAVRDEQYAYKGAQTSREKAMG